ncbi:2'-5' RNA ligase family protein [Ferruginibacter yonginensis]|uniref:2'-5' RNA ligase family protein n=1 Tax=Ferruginibacter yonginensis TaxID=1310416 RepID=A0ABV8QN53_9BACT
MPSIKNVHMLVLLLDDAAQSVVQTLRQQYYPTYASKMPAHLTLIHTLPVEVALFHKTLQAIAAAQPIFSVSINEIIPFKQGNAISVTSNQLMLLHQNMVKSLLPHLRKKDQLPYQPHITIQQKVTAWKAHTTNILLQQQWVAIAANAVAMQLLRHTNEGLKLIHTYHFKQT